MHRYRVVTIDQPFATWAVAGHNKFIVKDFRTGIPGWIIVVSSNKDKLDHVRFPKSVYQDRRIFPHGAAVGAVRIGECRELSSWLEDAHVATSERRHWPKKTGFFGWPILERIRFKRFKKHPGHPGLMLPDERLMNFVNKQFADGDIMQGPVITAALEGRCVNP